MSAEVHGGMKRLMGLEMVCSWRVKEGVNGIDGWIQVWCSVAYLQNQCSQIDQHQPR